MHTLVHTSDSHLKEGATKEGGGRRRKKKGGRPLRYRKKHYLCTRICACGEIGRRARLRIWWFRPCRFESYQAHRCSFTKKATTYTASPPGKPCKLLPLFVQLPWKAAVCCLCCLQNNKTRQRKQLVQPCVVWGVCVVVNKKKPRTALRGEGAGRGMNVWDAL